MELLLEARCRIWAGVVVDWATGKGGVGWAVLEWGGLWAGVGVDGTADKGSGG